MLRRQRRFTALPATSRYRAGTERFRRIRGFAAADAGHPCSRPWSRPRPRETGHEPAVVAAVPPARRPGRGLALASRHERRARTEEHTSELPPRPYVVCRLLL